MSCSTIEMFEKWNVTRALHADDTTRLQTLLNVWTWGNIIAQANQTLRSSDDNLERLNGSTGLDHDLQTLALGSEAVRCWLFQAHKRGETVTINDVPREYIRGLCRRVRREEMRLFCAAVWALNREGFTHPDQVAAAL
jgi:hypothetical protein